MAAHPLETLMREKDEERRARIDNGVQRARKVYDPRLDDKYFRELNVWNMSNNLRHLLQSAQTRLEIISEANLDQVRTKADFLSIEGTGHENVDEVADLSVSGAGGLDTGATPGTINTWYHKWLCCDSRGEQLTAIWSLSTTKDGLTLPDGRTLARRVHSGRNNAAGNLYRVSNAPGDNWFYYNEDIGAGDFLLLSGGTSLVFVAVPGVTVVLPFNCRRAEFSGDAHRVSAGEEGLNIRETGSGIPKSNGTLVLHAKAMQISATFLARLDTNQSIDYALQNAGTAFINVVAYEDIR